MKEWLHNNRVAYLLYCGCCVEVLIISEINTFFVHFHLHNDSQLKCSNQYFSSMDWNGLGRCPTAACKSTFTSAYRGKQHYFAYHTSDGFVCNICPTRKVPTKFADSAKWSCHCSGTAHRMHLAMHRLQCTGCFPCKNGDMSANSCPTAESSENKVREPATKATVKMKDNSKTAIKAAVPADCSIEATEHSQVCKWYALLWLQGHTTNLKTISQVCWCAWYPLQPLQSRNCRYLCLFQQASIQGSSIP